jgi:SAM-dependent methyltransferase
VTDHSSGHSHDDSAAGTATNSPGEWDKRYSDTQQMWSGRPNGALVVEVEGLAAGRALDVGCGEGADAVWLATRGWDVTALDVSQVALTRAAQHAREAGVDIRWLHTGLVDADLPARAFDLVSAQYPAVFRTTDDNAERALVGAVAVNGVLLVVHHADVHAEKHGFDPSDFVTPSSVAAILDSDWQVEANETRPRDVPEGRGSHHMRDVVLRARRLR